MRPLTASPARTALPAAYFDRNERYAYFGDRTLMVIPRNRRPTFANQEIEIHTLIRLQNVVVKKAVPATGGRFRCFPFPPSSGQFFIGNFQVQPAPRHVELYHVARPDERQGSTNSRFRRYVQDHGPVGGPAHSPVGDAHHVGDPFAQDLGRQRHVANFGETRVSFWSCPL